MRKIFPLLSLILCLLVQVVYADTPVLAWKLVRSIPKPPNHFTQGMVYADKQLFESAGRYGQSSLTAYDADSLLIQKKLSLKADIFAEGITFLNGKLYQSSWKSREIFVYDTRMTLLQTLRIETDSWGLTTDGHALIMGDGSNTLQFLDPATGKRLRTMTVTDDRLQTWNEINELEWIDGNILANVWHRDIVLLIDGKTGRIKGQYNLEKLSPELARLMPARDGEQVLNGLAWNPQKNTLLVTGKDWPVWFELEITLH
jgi:glutamine cyclotransferase